MTNGKAGKVDSIASHPMRRQRNRSNLGDMGEQEKNFFFQFAVMASRDSRSCLPEYANYWG